MKQIQNASTFQNCQEFCCTNKIVPKFASGLLILKGFHLSLDFKDDKIRLTGFYSVFNLFLVSYAQQKCVICLEFRFWKYHSHELFKSLYRTWRTKSLSCLFYQNFNVQTFLKYHNPILLMLILTYDNFWNFPLINFCWHRIRNLG